MLWRGACIMRDVILLITPSAPIKECAHALQSGTGRAVEVAATLQEAGCKLREREYAAVVIDQSLVEAEPDESNQILQPLRSAIPVYVNFAISGIDRVVRDT